MKLPGTTMQPCADPRISPLTLKKETTMQASPTTRPVAAPAVDPARQASPAWALLKQMAA